MVSTAIGWQCSGGSRPCSSRSLAVPTRDRDDDDGVALGSGDFGSTRGLLLPLSPLSLGSGERWTATRWRRGTGERLGIRGRGFYSRAHPWSSVDGGWRTRGDQRASSEAGLGFWGRGAVVGAAPRGRQGHAPGVTPGPLLPSLSGLGRRRIGVGRKKALLSEVANGWGPLAAAAGEAKGARGVGRWAAGPARARGPTCCCALAGLAGCWLGREAEQAEPAARPSSSFPFFVFFFFFLDLNSNLVWVFEFKMGAPNSLEF